MALLLAASCLSAGAQAADPRDFRMGLIQIAQPDGGNTTVFYPTRVPEVPVTVGPFALSWAPDASPETGNGRLIVISHGSGGAPWVHTDLARHLVRQGFVVAFPQHAGDNHLNGSDPGPPSWKLRPLEVGQAIDRVAAHPGLAPLLRLDAVGMFGGSAGGHTALTLAGGEWSPSRFRDHCLANLEADFSSCVGFTTLLYGNALDGIKRWLARLIIRLRFGDETPQRHTDPRIRAIVAMVPYAADFSMESLRQPVVPLGLVIAEKDINQVPAFHVAAVAAACEDRCETLARLTKGGHGAMLSPLPPFDPGSVADRLQSDPPGFDRAKEIPALNEAIAGFFRRRLGVD